MRTLAVLLSGLILAPALVGGTFAAGDAPLLPADGFSAGWSREGATKVYEGPALYDHIDGGGEAFLEMGFEACTVQRYKKGKETFTFEVYRMTDDDAALGIYLANCGKETPDKAFPERHTAGQSQVLCIKGRFYLVVTSPGGRPSLTQALVAAARALTSRLPKAEGASCLALLPQDGMVPRSERIIRGPIALQAAVTLGEGDILLLKGEVTAMTADYKGPSGARSTLILARYPSQETALMALKNLSAKLDPQFTPLKASENELLFKDREGRAGRAYLEGRVLRVQLGTAVSEIGHPSVN